MRSSAVRRLTLALAMTGAAAALPAAAQDQRQSARFDFQVRGVTVGTLTVEGVQQDRSYAVSGRLQSTGLAGMLRRMRYDATVQGVVGRNGQLSPQRYSQTGGIAGKSTEEVVVWQSGRPKIEKQVPPKTSRATDADPAQQRGTVDTLTTLYAVLRDVPRGQECGTDVVIYDGRYRMGLTVSGPRASQSGVTCSGQYVRQAGFSAEEMAERRVFPFTVHYAPLNETTSRVTQVTMESLYGNARLVRR